MPIDARSGQPPGQLSVSIDADVLREINRLRIVAPLVSNTAHDINNALQTIGGSAELLGLQSEIGPVGTRRIQAIATQAGRISTMLDLLLSFARPGGTERQNVDLADLVEKAVALRAFALNRARIALTVERVGGLPPVAAIDRGRILQVFLNLLLNAEAALAKRPDATIHVRIDRSAQDCSVVFTDNGPGMSTEGSARLSSADAIHELGADLSGIGLWVSARIAEQHGGRLEVVDAPATGASLRLSLPAGA